MKNVPAGSPSAPRAIKGTALRIAVLLACGAVAAFSAVAAYATLVATTNPLAALRVAPRQFDALNALGDLQLARGQTAPGTTLSLARASLGQQALNPRALRLAGMAQEMAGHREASAALFDLAQKSSRRDLGTQMWLIEDAVRRNDVGQALLHYDAALRVDDNAKAVLFPVLTRAMTDPDIRRAFAALVRRPTPWLSAFLTSYVEAGGNAPAIAEVALAAPNVPHDIANIGAMSAVLRALGNDDRRVAQAAALFARMPQSNSALLQGSGFSSDAVDGRFAPISWQLEDNANLTTGFEQNDTGTSLRATKSGFGADVVASKLLRLGAGRYDIAAVASFVDEAGNGNADLLIECVSATGRRPLASLSLRHSARQSFSIPPDDCAFQRVRIVMNSGEPRSKVLQVDKIEIAPMRGEAAGIASRSVK